MTIFLLSLGGFPPTAGFIAKWYMFTAAIGAGYYGLAIIGVLSSVVSVYFYLRIVVMMYMSERDARPVPPPVSGLALAGLVASVARGAGARRAAGAGDRLGRAVDCDDLLRTHEQGPARPRAATSGTSARVAAERQRGVRARC